jgi:uncharacterized membrane protein
MTHTHSHDGTDGVDALPTTRIEALHDATFAIVMTLLILEFRVPEVEDHHELVRGLLALWPTAVAYVLTFLNLGVYWVGQHNQFHYIRATDRTLLWINLLFLMLVSGLPFSTALLGRYPQEQLPYLLYGANMIVAGLTMYLHWCYATMHHRLTDHDIEDAFVAAIKRRILFAPLIAVIAMAVSFVSLPLSLLIYLILIPYYLLPGKVDRRWKKKAIPHTH